MLMPTRPDRLPHGGRDPEWEREPNEVRWIDPATGLKCWARRVDHSGAWCGYVRVERRQRPGARRKGPRGMLRTRREPGWVSRLQVHGGVTFYGSFWGRRGVWAGFDCSHCWDYNPTMEEMLENLGVSRGLTDSHSIYRNLAYVQKQCALMAKQVAARRKRG